MTLPEDKLDLILEILRQHDKRFDQIELNQRSDKQELLMAIQREGRDREKMEDKLEKVYESRFVPHCGRAGKGGYKKICGKNK